MGGDESIVGATAQYGVCGALAGGVWGALAGDAMVTGLKRSEPVR